jgi:glycosyltransferase involved in cell wall biosynthesis
MASSSRRFIARTVRRTLLRYVRSGTRRRDHGPDVFILVLSAWGMGGTVRAVHNLAGYLAQRHDVRLISVYRRRQEPFFGSFPPGVSAVALDDRRAGATPRALAPLRKLLLGRGSVLYNRAEIHSGDFSLWTDLQIVRQLRGRSGFAIGTRPGLNMMLADLAVPGLITIGEEQMNLAAHRGVVRAAIARRYPRLDALAVLTEADVEAYTKLLDGRAPRLVRIPNTVRAMEGVQADMSSRTVLAAGRLSGQKGFDMLVRAFARIPDRHPDWRLRIVGRGKKQEALQRQIDEAGLSGPITLAPASRELEEEMRRCSIFVLSSRFEGFPLVLLEAMYAGMAVVSFDCPTGPRDVIDDHRNGILVPAQDVDGLGDAIGELIADDDLRRRCGAAAAVTARRYTMDAVGPRWDALLAELRAGRA